MHANWFLSGVDNAEHVLLVDERELTPRESVHQVSDFLKPVDYFFASLTQPVQPKDGYD